MITGLMFLCFLCTHCCQRCSLSRSLALSLSLYPMPRSLNRGCSTKPAENAHCHHIQTSNTSTQKNKSTPCTALRFTSFMQARQALEAMREEHKENDCGFFAFTVVRSPLDWIVSLYDDICHRRLRGHKDTCPQQV